MITAHPSNRVTPAAPAAPAAAHVEEWRDLPAMPGLDDDFRTAYQISSFGRVRRTADGAIVPPWQETRWPIQAEGELRWVYMRMVRLAAASGPQERTVAVMDLVAAAFTIRWDRRDHLSFIDGNTMNCRADNLRWVRAEDQISALRQLARSTPPTGTHMTGEEWRPMPPVRDLPPALAALFDVSSLGRVRRRRDGWVPQPFLPKWGVNYFVDLRDGDPPQLSHWSQLALLIATAFRGAAPPQSQLHHLNRDRRDCRAANLRWLRSGHPDFAPRDDPDKARLHKLDCLALDCYLGAHMRTDAQIDRAMHETGSWDDHDEEYVFAAGWLTSGMRPVEYQLGEWPCTWITLTANAGATIDAPGTALLQRLCRLAAANETSGPIADQVEVLPAAPDPQSIVVLLPDGPRHRLHGAEPGAYPNLDRVVMPSDVAVMRLLRKLKLSDWPTSGG